MPSSPSKNRLSGKQKGIVVLVILACMILSATLVIKLYTQPKIRQLSASAWVNNIEMAAKHYQRDHGTFPSTEPREFIQQLSQTTPKDVTQAHLEALELESANNYLQLYFIPTENGVAIDPWKNPIQLSHTENNSFAAHSSGADEQPNTSDDIDSSQAKAELKALHETSQKNSQ